MSYSDDEFKIGDTEEEEMDLDLNEDLDDTLLDDDLIGMDENEEEEEGFAGIDGAEY